MLIRSEVNNHARHPAHGTRRDRTPKADAAEGSAKWPARHDGTTTRTRNPVALAELAALESLFDAGASHIGPADGVYARIAKPAMDRVLAGLLLLLTLPVLAVGVLLVRRNLGPGVLFRQQRVGQHGRLFTVYKLRTMGHDRRETSEEDMIAMREGRWDGIERRRTHKTDADPRHTNVGRWLRRLSVDELPQLFNVLRGDMSLVGPRPELPVVVERHYEPWMHRRHLVRPGITGLWQVSKRGEGEMHQHADLDIDYVRRLSLREDLRILLATPLAALATRQGS